MNVGIIVLFGRLKKINFNPWVFILLFIAFICTFVLYGRCMKIRHYYTTAVLKCYGCYDFYCDSVDIDLMVQIPSFDTTVAPSTEIVYHPKELVAKPKTFRLVYNHNGVEQYFDSLLLSADEIHSIKKAFFNSLSDDFLRQQHGLLSIQFIESKKKTGEISIPKNAKQKKFVQEYIPGRLPSISKDTPFPLFPIGQNDSTELTATANGLMALHLQIESDSLFWAESTVKHDRHHTSANYLLEIPITHYDTFQLSRIITKQLSWFRKYDLSQEAYDILLICDSSTNNFLKIKSIAIPFDNYPDFTYLNPQPDSIGKKVIYYKSPYKVERIKQDGVQVFVKYPERQSQQTARIFILTMLLSLLITGIINQVIKLNKDLKAERLFKDETSSCAVSVPNCTDCPLKSHCKHLKEN